MRIAFVTNPALGHLLPLLPLALAARDAGHEVVVVGGASIADGVERVGLRHVHAGPPDLPSVLAMVPERAGLTGRRLAAATWKGAFAGILAPELAAATLELASDWPPDLVIHEDSEQGSWIAAERLGIPHLAFQATAWRGTGLRLSAEPLNALRASLGLPGDPALERWHRHGYLGTRPRSLYNPDDPPPATTVPVRPVARDDGGGAVPSWVDATADGRPRVVVTMGTMLPGRTDVVAGILDGLAALDIDIVATVGPELDPAELGDRGPDVHVERWVPMSRVLGTADALVFHAGSGTMLAALAAGVPLVLLPVAADQPENADRCVAAGVGVALAPDAREPADVGRAARTVLEDVSYREAAQRVAAEIAAMPHPASLLPRLEALAAAGPDAVLSA
jgi:UDP:flavonoid glycosyltransferase YjiC (YdhE family)